MGRVLFTRADTGRKLLCARFCCRFLFGFVLVQFYFDKPNKGRDKGDEQYPYYHKLKMFLYCGDAAEEVSEQGEQRAPDQPAKYAERREPVPFHARNAGEERHKSTDKGEETPEEYCKRTPLVYHPFGFGDPFRCQRLDFAGFDDPPAKEMADKVVALISQDRRSKQDGQQHRKGNGVFRISGKISCGKQQGIPWEEGHEHHAGLNEDYQKNNGISRPEAKRRDPSGDCGTRISEKPHKKVNNVHWNSLIGIRALAPVRSLYDQKLYKHTRYACNAVFWG